MLEHPEVTKTEEKLTAVVHLTVARADIQTVMGPAIAEVMAIMLAQGIVPAGPLFSYHLKRPSDIFDFEVGFPVSGVIKPSGRVKPSKLPATKLVRAVYRGGYEGLGNAWGELFGWVKDEGLNARGSLWECYAVGPETDPDPAKWRTELNCPLV
ncbi:MAG: GyrI-like domain-containing protein [Pseudomonadota bacterium]